MTAVPETKETWTDNVDALSSTNLHAYLRDPIKFLMHRPAAELRQTSAQTLTTSTPTAITFGVEDLDDDPTGGSAHSTVTNTSRFTAIYPGWYRNGGGICFASNATGRRGTRWAKNGSAVDGGEAFGPSYNGATWSGPARDKLIYLDVGDYVELLGYQESGGNLATAVTSTQQPNMNNVWERLAA